MIEQFWLDTLVVFGMFVLRVGVPIALTIALGKWLEKKLKPPVQNNEETIVPTVHRSGKIIQLHCWDVKRCDPAIRAKCAAYKHPELPCWLAIQAEGGKVSAECFTCALYKPQSIAA